MGGGAYVRPRCRGCGSWDGPFVQNTLIGGLYCQRCDKTITTRDPKLEAKYHARVARRKRRTHPPQGDFQ